MSQGLITFDISRLVHLADRFNKAVLNFNDRQQLLTDLGSEVEDQTVERFDTKIAADGKPWKEISAKHSIFLARRFPGSQPPLIMTGGLRDSVDSAVSSWSVLVGATKIYAASNQWGFPARGVPARPFLGLNSENIKSLEIILSAFLEKNFWGV